MRNISLSKRNEVIRLFFHGYSYDEIVERLGISKGSVVNIIEEFRDGTLLEPPNLIDYIDELRKLAVDLKKHHINAASMNSRLRQNSKLLELGISVRDIQRLLNIYRYIEFSTVSIEEFIQAAMELGRLTKENSISYADLLRDYKAKLILLNEIGDEIETKQKELKEKQRKLEELQLAMIKHTPGIMYHANHSPPIRVQSEIRKSGQGSYDRTIERCKGRKELSMCRHIIS